MATKNPKQSTATKPVPYSTKDKFNPLNDPDVGLQNYISYKNEKVDDHLVWPNTSKKNANEFKKNIEYYVQKEVNRDPKNIQTTELQPVYLTEASARRAAPYAASISNTITDPDFKDSKGNAEAIGPTGKPVFYSGGQNFGYVPRAEPVNARKSVLTPEQQKIVEKNKSSRTPAEYAAWRADIFQKEADKKRAAGNTKAADLWAGYADNERAKANKLGGATASSKPNNGSQKEFYPYHNPNHTSPKENTGETSKGKQNTKPAPAPNLGAALFGLPDNANSNKSKTSSTSTSSGKSGRNWDRHPPTNDGEIMRYEKDIGVPEGLRFQDFEKMSLEESKKAEAARAKWDEQYKKNKESNLSIKPIAGANTKPSANPSNKPQSNGTDPLANMINSMPTLNNSSAYTSSGGGGGSGSGGGSNSGQGNMSGALIGYLKKKKEGLV